MSLKRVQNKLNFQLEEQQQQPEASNQQNPLYSHSHVKWYNNFQQTCNGKYLGRVEQKLLVLELQRLFQRYDVD